MNESAKHPVATTKRTLEIIEVLKDMNNAGVTEIADRVGFSKSAVHNHLSTLREDNYVVKDGDEYELGLKFLDVGGYRRNQMEIFKSSKAELDQLARETGELANIMVEEDGMGVYLYRSFGEKAVDLNLYAGTRADLHNQALGKAILAHLPSERVDAIIDSRGLPASTENTIVDREDLEADLELIREQGNAVDNEELTRGLMCIAAPIQGEDGVLGAISISAPKSRMSDDEYKERIQSKVMNTANVVELQIRY